MINTIIENKEWIFSGIGVLVLTLLFRFLFGSKKSISTHNSNITSNFVNVDLNKEHFYLDSSIESEERFNIFKNYIRVLFIDDDTKFKIIKILNTAGWKTQIVKDIDNLDSDLILNTHIFFIDINGVGIKLDFKDQGLGLANAIKQKYPNKKVVIYSSDENGNRFHKALRNVDDFLPKNAEPIEFQSIIENFAIEINNES